MNLEIFLLLLLMVSVLTGLFTEGIKNILNERKINYYANTLAGIVAVVLSAAMGVAYTILADAQLNSKMAVILIALVLLSWLCAMVGYDKVIQAISQFRAHSGNSKE